MCDLCTCTESGEKDALAIADLPLSGDFYLWGSVSRISILLVDSDLFLPAGRTADSVFFVDMNLLLGSTVFAARKSRGDGSVASFVTFPSDARRGRSCSFYLDLSCFCCDSVTPIRGREDTEGDRDAGVKVQVGGGAGVLS